MAEIFGTPTTDWIAGMAANDVIRLGDGDDQANGLNADDIFIYDKATGNLFFDNDGAGAEDQVLMANLGAGTALSASDISIFDEAASASAKDLGAMQAAIAMAEMQIG